MSASAVEMLRDGIDQLAALDVDSLTDNELHEHVIAVQRLRDRLGAVNAPLLQRWQARQIWAGDGSRSAPSRLARDTHCSTTTANTDLRRARSLTSMPATATAAATGELSLDQVDLLVSANTTTRRRLFGEHEQSLVDTIRGLRYNDARRAMRYWCQRADAELGLDDGTADRQRDASTLTTATTLDDMVVISASLDPVSGAIVTGELDRIVDQLRLHHLRDGIERTPAQRRAAALVEMAQRSATMPTDGRRPKPLFTVLLGDRSFEHLCELANATVITPEHLVPFIDRAMLETILFDGPTTIVSVSNKRSFTGAVRRGIETRDRHCQHPSGCDVPADRCDVDHIIPHAHGGPTSQSNGRMQCPPHNRNATKHDHHAQPRPERTITRLDELRARIRWRTRHDHPDELLDRDDTTEHRNTG